MALNTEEIKAITDNVVKALENNGTAKGVKASTDSARLADLETKIKDLELNKAEDSKTNDNVKEDIKEETSNKNETNVDNDTLAKLLSQVETLTKQVERTANPNLGKDVKEKSKTTDKVVQSNAIG